MHQHSVRSIIHCLTHGNTAGLLIAPGKMLRWRRAKSRLKGWTTLLGLAAWAGASHRASSPPLISTPFLLAAAISIALTGCAPSQYWDDFASKSEVLRLFTIVPCDADVKALPEHQTYYHVTYFDPWPSPGEHFISYPVGQDKEPKRGIIFFTQVFYVGLQHFTAVSTGKPGPNERDVKCGALVILPATEHVGPFFLPASPAKLQAEARQKLLYSALNGLTALIVVVVLAGFAAAGSLDFETQAKCLVSAGSVILLNAAAWWCLLGINWINIRAALAYYAAVDQLPHDDLRYFLPLSWSQAHTLMSGPPYPPVTTTGSTETFYEILLISIGIWVIAYGFRTFTGAYYLFFIPNPFKELLERCEAQGRAPTPDEYLSALTGAAMGMNAWEIGLLKRKMERELPDE